MRIIFVPLLALVAAGCVSKSDERAGTPEDGGRADAARRPDARRQPDAPEEEPDGPLPPDGPVRRDARPRPPDAPQVVDAAPDACVPMNCMQRGASCGTTDDGCGGTLMCGTCMMPETCGGGGTPNMCGVNRAWPLWKMPDSSGGHCVEPEQAMAIACSMTDAVGYGGQDGNSSVNPPSLQPSSGVVTDAVTALKWQQVPGMQMAMGMQTALFTLDEARMYCTALNLGGTGWRLPSRIELITIVDYGREMPAIDGTAFPMTPSARFWTRSPFSNDPTNAYVVDFSTGLVDSLAGAMTAQVRCVK